MERCDLLARAVGLTRHLRSRSGCPVHRHATPAPAFRLVLPSFVAALLASASPVGAQGLHVELKPGVERLIRQALQSHPNIAAAQAERQASEFEVHAARNRFYPSPAVQLREDRDGTATVVSLTQPLWTGGRLTAGLDAAYSRADAAALAITEARYALALRVVNAWAAYRQALGRENAQSKNLQLLQVYAESVGRRVHGGASAEVDRELVGARLSQAQSDLAAASAARRTVAAQLSRLLGLPVPADDMEAEPPGWATDPGSGALPSIDEFLQLTIDYSPALRRLNADIEASLHDVVQRRAVLWPSVNLRAEHQRNMVSTAGPGSHSRVMLTLDYAPDAGLSASAAASAAQTRITSQQERRAAARRELADTVQSDYEIWLAGHDQLRGLRRTLEANTAVLASYERLLTAGRRSWLDVLNIARELTAARTALTDIEAQIAAARIRLHLHAGDLPGISPHP